MPLDRTGLPQRALRWVGGEGAQAITPLLACVQLANSVAMALPLTAVNLFIVKDVGFGLHPEWLIAYDAAQFVPSIANVLFGLLSDCVWLGGGGRAPEGRPLRMRWVMLGMLGAGVCLVPFAAGAFRRPQPIFAFGICGSVFGALTSASLEGLVVERGRQVAEQVAEGDSAALSRIRSNVQLTV
ncbi:hypothetical protein T492DRAFT_874396 [Pavlovales sp. CCMP2436]|nr:hypothetical protein T492DRAFT_874396 [Pavlovales sp. CCMP2436]